MPGRPASALGPGSSARPVYTENVDAVDSRKVYNGSPVQLNIQKAKTEAYFSDVGLLQISLDMEKDKYDSVDK
jgi:hypothetical protein